MNKRCATIYVTCLILVFAIGTFFILNPPEIIGGDTKYEPVLTGSMEPAIPVGGVVIIKPTNPETIQIDDIICFQFSESTLITHRVVNVSTTGFVTKGDANENNDLRIVEPNQIVGKVVLILPLLGYIGTFAQTTIGFIVLLAIPAALIIIFEIRNILYELKKPQQEKIDN